MNPAAVTAPLSDFPERRGMAGRCFAPILSELCHGCVTRPLAWVRVGGFLRETPP